MFFCFFVWRKYYCVGVKPSSLHKLILDSISMGFIIVGDKGFIVFIHGKYFQESFQVLFYVISYSIYHMDDRNRSCGLFYCCVWLTSLIWVPTYVSHIFLDAEISVCFSYIVPLTIYNNPGHCFSIYFSSYLYFWFS